LPEKSGPPSIDDSRSQSFGHKNVDKRNDTALPEPSKRCPELKRDKPKLSVSQEKKVNSRVKVTVEISGAGPVRVSGKWYWQGHGSDKVNSNLLSAKQVRLPDSGGKATVSWQFRYPPIAASWWWGVDAENVGPWAGKYNLGNCCTASSSKPRCLPDGSVRCGDGSNSERCVCLRDCRPKSKN
jgi:hypothetical protein